MEPKDRQLREPNAPGKKSYEMTTNPRIKFELDDDSISRMRPESYRTDKGTIFEWHQKPEPHHTFVEYNNQCSECKELHTGGYRSRHPQA